MASPAVAEAAVVGKPHAIKGEAIVAFVVPKVMPSDAASRSALIRELKQHVVHEIGALARPDEIRLGDNLPKTRSGKIMRRLLRQLARGEHITQDISTL